MGLSVAVAMWLRERAMTPFIYASSVCNARPMGHFRQVARWLVGWDRREPL